MNKEDFKKYIDEDGNMIFVCSMCTTLGRNYEGRHHHIIYENLKNHSKIHQWLCEEHFNLILDLIPDIDPFLTKLLKILEASK